jgi:hypothetical protein
MTTSESTENGSHSREAACHRCGWNQPVRKIGRAERAQLGVGHEFGWLCDDCVRDLSSAGTREPAQATAVKDSRDDQVRRSRSVA